MFKQEWIAQLIVESTHEYSVQATSEEEAIAQAELLYENGELGAVLGFDVQMADAFAVDADPEEEEDFE